MAETISLAVGSEDGEAQLPATTTIATLIGRAARTFAQRPAVIDADSGRVLSYSSLVRSSQALAGALWERGVGAGSRVGMVMRNSPEFLVAYLAAVRCGAVVVPFNFRLSERELLELFVDSEPAAVITDESSAETVARVCDAAGVDIRIAAGDADGFEPLEYLTSAERGSAPSPGIEDTHACAVLYTAGTTGRSKGAVLSHRNVVWTTAAYAMRLRMDASSVYLAVPPMFHIVGSQCSVFPVLCHGGTVVTTRSFAPESFLEAVERYSVTHLFVIPVMANMLMDMSELQHDAGSVRCCASGAAPLPEKTRAWLLDRLSGVSFFNCYGSTEGGPCSSTYPPSSVEMPSNCVGTPFFGVALTVLDDEGNELRPGEVGEVAVQSPSVFTEYWRDEASTQEAFARGWYRVGDIGYFDDGGNLFLVDRRRDMVISGGENVYAGEVENVLLASPHVREAAVIGVPDPKWGEAVMAVIVPSDPGRPPGEREIIDFCRARLAHYKCPRKVVVVDEMARNAFGKIDKTALRERFRDPVAQGGSS